MASLQALTEAEACAYLQRFKLIDPSGAASVASAVAGAQCYALRSAYGAAVFALRINPARAWVSVAAGETTASITPALAQAIERQAKQGGAPVVRFQTARPGLVRRAERLGYRVVGWIMEKELQHEPAT